jgi:thiol-disulfide isomerase/thioredoxin
VTPRRLTEAAAPRGGLANFARAIAVLALVASIALHAAPVRAADNPTVARLAREGHWEPAEWPAHRAMLGTPAPRLDLSDWMNGHVLRGAWDGKVVVVDFWATWCAPCRRLVPHNNDLVRKFKSRGVLFIGACGAGSNGGQDQMRSVSKSLGLMYPTAKVTDASARAWKVRYWPTYAIIDRKGRVRAIGVQPDYVEPIVTALLAESAR